MGPYGPGCGVDPLVFEATPLKWKRVFVPCQIFVEVTSRIHVRELYKYDLYRGVAKFKASNSILSAFYSYIRMLPNPRASTKLLFLLGKNTSLLSERSLNRALIKQTEN